MRVGNQAWILRQDGTQTPVKIEKLGVFHEGIVQKCAEAGDGTRTGLWIAGMTESDIPAGSIISSIFPCMAGEETFIENPGLKGLLAARHDLELIDIEAFIRREVMEKTRFVVMFRENEEGSLKFPYLTAADDAAYQPVFTSCREMMNWMEGMEMNPQIMAMCIENVCALLKNNEILQGIVINPFTDNLILDRFQLAEWENLKTKDQKAQKAQKAEESREAESGQRIDIEKE